MPIYVLKQYRSEVGDLRIPDVTLLPQSGSLAEAEAEAAKTLLLNFNCPRTPSSKRPRFAQVLTADGKKVLATLAATSPTTSRRIRTFFAVATVAHLRERDSPPEVGSKTGQSRATLRVLGVAWPAKLGWRCLFGLRQQTKLLRLQLHFAERAGPAKQVCGLLYALAPGKRMSQFP